jgi:hypothetical protein
LFGPSWLYSLVFNVTVYNRAYLQDNSEEYEQYAQEAFSRGEADLGQFFDELAQLFYREAEKLAVVEVAQKAFKTLLLERWRNWIELSEI